jgi:hypothetical protein
MYYSIFALIIVFTVGPLVSWMARKLGWAEDRNIDKKYLVDFSIFKRNKVESSAELTNNEEIPIVISNFLFFLNKSFLITK